MTLLASPDDVLDRLGRRTLTDDEGEALPGLLEEASVEVSEFCGTTFPEGVPDTVRIVTSRIAARALSQATSDTFEPNATQMVDQVGEWQQSRSYSGDSAGGGVWLTKVDRRKLGRYSIRGSGAFNIDLTPQS